MPLVERALHTYLLIVVVSFLSGVRPGQPQDAPLRQAQAPVVGEPVAEEERAHNVTQVLLDRFGHLFGSSKDQAGASAANQVSATAEEDRKQSSQVGGQSETDAGEQQQQAANSALETRTSDQSSSSEQSGTRQPAELPRRNYFRILNRVFSRVELPEVFKLRSGSAGGSAAQPTGGGHCGAHIGCIEELPNFPSLLKLKPNVSASFTIYTRDAPKAGHRIPYEPLMHHQLQDAKTDELELQCEALKSMQQVASQLLQLQAGVDLKKQVEPAMLRRAASGAGPAPPRRRHHHRVPVSNAHKIRRQTAASWRSAAKVAHSLELPFDLAALEQSGFDSSQATRIIVGGYFAKEDEEWIDELIKQWLLLEPSSNVIKVSWQDSNRGLYHTAAHNSRIVGRQLSLFLHYLDEMFHIDLDRFHLVGHSLGAHIAGFVGADNEGRIARITGLDPAGPIFVDLNTSMRLDPSDAKFVDVMHTNGGPITKGALGLSTPSGHVDYYCNGGSLQPGCYFSSVTRSIMDPVERVACNHRRSYRYFTEIIKIAIARRQWAGSAASGSAAGGLIGEASKEAPGGRPPSDESPPDYPRAFLFEAKQEVDLFRLVQPELTLLKGPSAPRGAHQHQLDSPAHLELQGQAKPELGEAKQNQAPLRRRIEFHLLRPEFPPNARRGLYFFRSRPEAPFFGSRQYALTIRAEQVVKRKIALMVKINGTLVGETELDELDGAHSLVFAPNDPKTIDAARLAQGRAPDLWLMWRQRSFNLLLGQPNEIHLSSIELSLLDDEANEGEAEGSHDYERQRAEEGPSGEESVKLRVSKREPQIALKVIKYGPNHHDTSIQSVLNRSNSSAGPQAGGPRAGGLALARNQWHKFEGRL